MGSKFVVLFFVVLSSKATLGAGCCGGGSSLPSLITGDYKGQVSLVTMNKAFTHYATPQGELRSNTDNKKEVTETFSLIGSAQIAPLWQLGITLPVKNNTYEISGYKEQTLGVGDLQVNVAYEFLPEYNYSFWKPKGYFFISQTLPVAESIYDSDKILKTDTLGGGFLATSLGLSFVKVYPLWDFLFSLNYQFYKDRDFNDGVQNLKISPGPSYGLLFGMGYSFSGGNTRLGTLLDFTQSSAKKLSGDQLSESHGSTTGSVGVSLSHLYQSYSFTFSYSDQTLIPWNENALIGRSLQFSVVRFFAL